MEPSKKVNGLGRRYFSRPPVRSYYFWVNTIFLLVIVGTGAFFMARARAYLNGEAIGLVLCSLAAVLLLWIKLSGFHQSVHVIYQDALDAKPSEMSRLDIVLDDLAYLSYAGFALALFALGSLYLASLWIITAASRR